MPFNRRRFLGLLFSSSILMPFRHLLAAPISSLKPSTRVDSRRCLAAWIDTLMPADATSPGAVELGVHLRIADKAALDRDYLRLVESGCLWLDRMARERGMPSFPELDDGDREAVAGLAEGSAPRSLPRAFFDRTLDDTFHYYYANRRSWAVLAYRGPPQPLGFMDYSRPPSE